MHVLPRTPDRGHDLHVRTGAQLREAGFSRRAVEAMVAEGRIQKLGRRWYGTTDTPPTVAAALAAGRRLTCVSALELHGIWVPRVLGRHEVGRRAPVRAECAALGPEVVLHAPLRSWPDDEPILSVRRAVAHASRCVGVEDLAILLESAANLRLLSLSEIDELVATLPIKQRRALGRIDPSAQSGTETRVRRYVQRLGARVTAQPGLLPDERMDMLVGEVLVIECDSRRHHADPSAYARDRRRDQMLTLAGYRVVRLTWEDVELRWPVTQSMLRSLIRKGLHRAPRSLRSR